MGTDSGGSQISKDKFAELPAGDEVAIRGAYPDSWVRGRIHGGHIHSQVPTVE